jgi:serine/threonine protein kinase
MQHIEGARTLRSILQERRLDEAECRVIFDQLTSAIQYIHMKGVCHRDLKTESI